MAATTLALLIITPFVLVFVYATWHEYRRYRTEGRSSYGLSYDPETNTTHVGAIPEDETAYDPQDFEPDLLATQAADLKEAADEAPGEDRPAAQSGTDGDTDGGTDSETARDPDHPDPDHPYTDPKSQEKTT